MLQDHCTNSKCHIHMQSQQQLQLQLTQSCLVIIERYLEQQRFNLSPEHSVWFSSSDR